MGEIQDKLAADDGSMGEKEIAQHTLEVGVDINNALHAIAYDMAEKTAAEEAQRKLAEKPAEPPRLSLSYNEELFNKDAFGRALDY